MCTCRNKTPQNLPRVEPETVTAPRKESVDEDAKSVDVIVERPPVPRFKSPVPAKSSVWYATNGNTTGLCNIDCDLMYKILQDLDYEEFCSLKKVNIALRDTLDDAKFKTPVQSLTVSSSTAITGLKFNKHAIIEYVHSDSSATIQYGKKTRILTDAVAFEMFSIDLKLALESLRPRDMLRVLTLNCGVFFNHDTVCRDVMIGLILDQFQAVVTARGAPFKVKKLKVIVSSHAETARILSYVDLQSIKAIEIYTLNSKASNFHIGDVLLAENCGSLEFAKIGVYLSASQITRFQNLTLANFKVDSLSDLDIVSMKQLFYTSKTFDSLVVRYNTLDMDVGLIDVWRPSSVRNNVGLAWEFHNPDQKSWLMVYLYQTKKTVSFVKTSVMTT